MIRNVGSHRTSPCKVTGLFPSTRIKDGLFLFIDLFDPVTTDDDGDTAKQWNLNYSDKYLLLKYLCSQNENAAVHGMV